MREEDDTNRPVVGDVYLDRDGVEHEVLSVCHQDRTFSVRGGVLSYDGLTHHSAGFFMPWVWVYRTD